MAKMVVDALVERDGRYAPCRTHEIPLGQPIEADRLTRVDGVSPGAYDALAARYGHDAEKVLAIAAERRQLCEPVVAGLPDVLAEVAYAVRHEQARSAGDALLRRTRLGLLAGRSLGGGRSRDPLRVAQVIGTEFGWDATRVAAEVAAWDQEAAAEGIAVVVD